jgi:transcription elongation factor Elf1
MFLNEEFLKIYEELSVLNEESKKPVLLKDVIGCKNKQPILDQEGKSGKESLLDFVDIDATKKNNPAIPEDPNSWPVYTNPPYNFIIKCPNETCRTGPNTSYSITGGTLWRRITKNLILSPDSTARELCLCKKCVDAKKPGTRVSWTMVDVGGCKNKMPIKATTTSLFDYLDIEMSIKANPELANKNPDPKLWRPFEEFKIYKYYFKCPICHTTIERSSKTLASIVRNYDKDTAGDMVTCQSCIQSKHDSIASIPELWDRVPDWLFIDKSVGANAKLSSRGFDELYKLNAASGKRIPKAFINAVMEKNNDIRIVNYFTPYSEITLPFKCTVQNCGYEYTSSIANAFTGLKGSCGCPACAEATTSDKSSSKSEALLRETITKLLNLDKLSVTPKEGFYKPIDVLFEHNNNLFGIEYDGGIIHVGEKIAVDEAKVKLYSDKHNIKFIRVREPGCDDFNQELAKVIKIDKPLIYLTTEKYITCIKEICSYIGYRLTTDDEQKLITIFTENQGVKEYKAQRALARKKHIEKKRIQDMQNTPR